MYATLIRFSSDVFNERLDNLVSNGKLTVADGVDSEEFKRHLAAEYRRKKTDKFTGRIK